MRIGKKMQLLGEGVSSKVYETSEGYAVKVFSDEVDYRFYREVATARELEHPYIVEMLGVDDNSIIFKKYDGTLVDHIDKTNPIDRKIIIFKILCGLEHMHQKGFIHRDIKPSNILMNDDMTVKIADFGLATKNFTGKTHTGKVQTVWYRAPEVILTHGKYDEKIDVWSVGVILFEMLFYNTKYLKRDNRRGIMKDIFKLIGKPDYVPKEWQDYKSENRLDLLLAYVDKTEADFLKKILAWERLSATEALKHPYFLGLEKPVIEMKSPKRQRIDDTFESNNFLVQEAFSFMWKFRKNVHWSTLFMAYGIFYEYYKKNDVRNGNLAGFICLVLCSDVAEVIPLDYEGIYRYFKTDANEINNIRLDIIYAIDFRFYKYLKEENYDEKTLHIRACLMTNYNFIDNLEIDQEKIDYIENMLPSDMKKKVLTYF
jgi:serine/threonine protein kinase